jgi:mutator protein MutT
MEHILKKFAYCPACGSNHFEIHNEKSKICTKCGFCFYLNPSSAVAAFIVNDKNELLVCRRGKNPAKGMLDLPGGFVDKGETAEQALVREIKEELNLFAENLIYLYSLPNSYRYSNFDIPTLDMFYLCSVNDFSTLQANDDVSETFFINIKNLKKEDFGLSSIKKAIEIFQLKHS